MRILHHACEAGLGQATAVRAYSGGKTTAYMLMPLIAGSCGATWLCLIIAAIINQELGLVPKIFAERHASFQRTLRAFSAGALARLFFNHPALVRLRMPVISVVCWFARCMIWVRYSPGRCRASSAPSRYNDVRACLRAICLYRLTEPSSSRSPVVRLIPASAFDAATRRPYPTTLHRAAPPRRRAAFDEPLNNYAAFSIEWQTLRSF